MTLNSMTGFATLSGNAEGIDWLWEMRSVNGRGLDIRLRLPEGLEALEPILRKDIAARMGRGSVSLNLKTSYKDMANGQSLNTEAMQSAIDAMLSIQAAAETAGLTLAAPAPTDILIQRGVMEQARSADRVSKHQDAIYAQVAPLLDDIAKARAGEGAALAEILSQQIYEVEKLVIKSAEFADARAAQGATLLKKRVATLLGATDRVDEDRLAQELALLAVKADVTEEIDRLKAHIASARALLVEKGPVGRKLDFLMQEFNREANTLCSKSGSSDLTNAGLALKVIIDQMREQCQNVE